MLSSHRDIPIRSADKTQGAAATVLFDLQVSYPKEGLYVKYLKV